MSTGIYVALSGARAQSRALDSVARNIANSSTSGYKAERLAFNESLDAAQAQSPDQRQVITAEPVVDLRQGRIDPTGNPLDLALQGDGFFAIGTPAGERLTRDGSFRIDVDGMLVNSVGYNVLNRNGEPMQIPHDTVELEITQDGEIYANEEFLGEIKVQNFEKASLQREGDNMFVATGAPLEGADAPLVVSEALESSNFDTVRGVVEIVKVSRTFQALLQMIESYKETESRAAKALGGPK